MKKLLIIFKRKKQLTKSDVVLLMSLKVRKAEKIVPQTLNIYRDGQWQKHTYL